MLSHELNEKTASQFAGLTLRNVVREYPHVLQHVLTGGDDFKSPSRQHPIFFGCFDWHSCVHGYWQLATLIRLFPGLPLAADVGRQFDVAFTDENVRAEIAYFNRPTSRGFERPYGWAWLLALATELKQSSGDRRDRWHAAILPLAKLIADRFTEFLPKAVYPIRSGTHSSTAFALTLSHGYAIARGDQALAKLIDEKVRSWYGSDTAAQAWEPSLDDFLSPILMEAACMRSMLPIDEFRQWLGRFLPQLAEGVPSSIFTPARASDRSDGKIAHLDGLNFSRAWCMRRIASALLSDDPRVPVLQQAAQHHLQASLPHISDDYAGEHWLATFALLAMLG
jgi:hypothetical protein